MDLIRKCNPELDQLLVDNGGICLEENDVLNEAGFIISEFSEDKLTMLVSYIPEEFYIEFKQEYTNYIWQDKE